jgi:uncharacterized protein YndB with AHSA1/START domain
MADLTIQNEIVVDAPQNVVWQTISDPDQITLWFADRVDVEVKPGASGVFVFEDRATKNANTVAITIDAVDPPRRLAFRWGHPQGVEPRPDNSVLVQFTLTAENDERTRVKVVESGLEEVRWPATDKTRYADDHRNGWAIHFGRLVELFAGRAR